jgi:type II secretory pathway component PulF
MRMSDTVLSAKRLGSVTGYFMWVAASMVVTAPLSMAVIQGSLRSMEVQDQAGGTLPVFGTLIASVKGQALPYVLASCGLLAAVLVFRVIWRGLRCRFLRHRFALVPPLKLRAQAEALSWMMWSLGMSARAGLTHQAAYQLAAQTIPNAYLREIAMREAAQVRENQPLSEALAKSSLLPPTYADIVHNGELTGNVASALDDIGRAAQADFEASDGKSRAQLMLLLYVPLAVLCLFLVVILAKSWYTGLIEFGLKDT